MTRSLIALVEDDPHIVNLLDDLFGEEGYRTITFLEGIGAYAALAHAQPDLVLLDLWMERQNTGWMIYEELCTHDATAHIPVVICSADIVTLRTHALEITARGDAVVEKPFNITTLLATIADLLGRAPAARAMARV